MADLPGLSTAGATTGFGNATQSTSINNNETTEKIITDGSGGSTFGSKIILSDSSVGTLNTSDYGAILSGTALGQAALGFASDVQSSVRLLGLGAMDVVKEKAESDITKLTTPIVWLVGLGLAAVVLLVWALRSFFKKGD